jgi:cytochrome c-type protein NapB
VSEVTTQPAEASYQRLVALGPAAVLALAVVGFFTGTAQLGPGSGPENPGETSAHAPAPIAPTAPSYAELADVDQGPNADWEAKLPVTAGRDLLAPVPAPTPAAREAALAARAERRAYLGAPPAIPHPVTSRSAASCMSCHAEGLDVGEVSAPAIPHRAYVNCLQCHAGPPPGALGQTPASGFDSGFVGLPEQREGERAGPGAPPVIPHPTAMRERCTSCHVQASSGLKTTHPWRVSCMQCHASSTGFAR